MSEKSSLDDALSIQTASMRGKATKSAYNEVSDSPASYQKDGIIPVRPLTDGRRNSEASRHVTEQQQSLDGSDLVVKESEGKESLLT